MTLTEERSSDAPLSDVDPADRPIPVTRRRIDHVLVGLGAVAAVVLVVAGGLLTWGSNFAEDYVSDELSAQNISFPDAASLQEEGRDDLVKFAGTTIDAERAVAAGRECRALVGLVDGALQEERAMVRATEQKVAA